MTKILETLKARLTENKTAIECENIKIEAAESRIAELNDDISDIENQISDIESAEQEHNEAKAAVAACENGTDEKRAASWKARNARDKLKHAKAMAV